MKNQSQIIQFKPCFLPRPGFLIIEVLVSLVFCLTCILIMFKFHSDILFLYERFLVRNIALNLAINSLERSKDSDIGNIEQGILYGGRPLKLFVEANKSDPDANVAENLKHNVVVVWQNSAGKNEKLTLGLG